MNQLCKDYDFRYILKLIFNVGLWKTRCLKHQQTGLSKLEGLTDLTKAKKTSMYNIKYELRVDKFIDYNHSNHNL